MLKLEYVSDVTPPVRIELLSPEVRSGCWNLKQLAPPVGMPEAAIDKDDSTVPGKDDVWATGETADVKAVPEPPSVELASDQHLGLGVASPDSRHHSAARLGVDDIDQRRLRLRSQWEIQDLVARLAPPACHSPVYCGLDQRMAT